MTDREDRQVMVDWYLWLCERRAELLSRPRGGLLELVPCADFDGDCMDVEDPWVCWLYDPGRGYCRRIGIR